MQRTGKPATQLKITAVGEFFVGKTSLITRFVKQTFDVNYSATIGFTFLTKCVRFKENSYILNIWDTSGSERHRSLAPNYFRGSDCCILIYDLTNPKTLQSLEFWIEEFRKYASSGPDQVPLILVGNKSDAEYDHQIIEDAKKFASDHSIDASFTASALSGSNIDAIFDSILAILSTRKARDDCIGIDIKPEKEEESQRVCC